ncbi:MAG: hypothetical protein D6725_12500, partial [Planctomycetota bacterium]
MSSVDGGDRCVTAGRAFVSTGERVPMSHDIAYIDGQFVPIDEATVHVFDLGLVLGAAVTEMIRTIDHEPFHLDEHMDRLYRSLKAVGFPTRPER